MYTVKLFSHNTGQKIVLRSEWEPGIDRWVVTTTKKTYIRKGSEGWFRVREDVQRFYRYNAYTEEDAQAEAIAWLWKTVRELTSVRFSDDVPF